MNKETKYYQDYSYFGAANGYDGFRSNFKKIFNPKDFDLIFVIKGGPGVGKNSLMKKVKEHFRSELSEVTNIYCSSDIRSLDGVILKKNNKKIALIDGTAPHETDAKFPHLIDELIDLSRGLDKSKLSNHKEEIFKNIENKKKNYDKAYFYLSLAGKTHSEIDALLSDSDVYLEAENVVDNILSNYYKGDILSDNTDKSFFISGFSKEGYTTLPIHSNNPIKVISLSGDGISELIVMRALYHRLLNYKTITKVCASPYTDKCISAVFTHNYSFNVDSDAEFIDTSVLLKGDSEVQELIKLRKEFLNSAKECLVAAAGNHQKLEEIYGDAMNFDYNSECFTYISSVIDKKLAES